MLRSSSLWPTATEERGLSAGEAGSASRSPRGSPDGCSPGRLFHYNVLGDIALELPSEAIPRNREIINVSCFMLLRFGVNELIPCQK